MTLLQIQPHPLERPIDPSVDHGIQAIVAGISTTETCNTDLAAAPWDFDARPGYGPGSSMGDVIPTGAPRQGELPAGYREASETELHARITAAKTTLGDRVVVLGTPPEGGPAGIQEILTVDSPRPRHRDDPELTGARRHLLGLLGVEA